MNAEEFEAIAGRPPERDDLERVNCPKASTGPAHSEYPRHTQCGFCAICGKPKIVCAEQDCRRRERQCDGTEGFAHVNGDGSWWAHDAQGIELCRVCARCERAKLSRYRPEILEGYDQRDVDEPIEPD